MIFDDNYGIILLVSVSKPMLWVLIRITSPSYVIGAHYNRLTEAILMSTHNIGFYEDLTKIIFRLSSNTHLISSSVLFSLYFSGQMSSEKRWSLCRKKFIS